MPELAAAAIFAQLDFLRYLYLMRGDTIRTPVLQRITSMATISPVIDLIRIVSWMM